MNSTDNLPNNDHSITFQLPRTAVFVGQCVVCHGTPMLQGSWIVFPVTQTCDAAGTVYKEIPPEAGQNGLGSSQNEIMQMTDKSTRDSMYLLLYYK